MVQPRTQPLWSVCVETPLVEPPARLLAGLVPSVILDDANNPAVERDVYVIPYNESVDGYWHAYFVDSPNPRKRGVRYSRTRNHPLDPRCPECQERRK